MSNPEIIEIGKDLVLLKKDNKFTPYRKSQTGLHPTRGKNKNGHLVWRTYKSVAEAKENLGLLED